MYCCIRWVYIKYLIDNTFILWTSIELYSFVEKYLPEEMLESIEEMLDSTLKDVIAKYDIDYQITEAHDTLKQQWDKIDGTYLFYKIYLYIRIYYVSRIRSIV